MEIKASDLSARLLATENLSVVRARARTASFDIKSRVLTLPMWKDMTPQIEDMLIGHEVGHALYTLDQYMEPLKENPKMMSYMNILEDVRIEKLIKRKYPGLRKRMNEGYKQLNDRDFFGTKQVQDFDSLLLIDKINLYFKAGFSCGVSFTPDEKVFVNRAERTETVEDVIELANDVYAYSKQQAEERKQRMKVENPQDAEDEEEATDSDFDLDAEGEWDEEMDDVEDEPFTKSGNKSRQNDDSSDEGDDLESKTERVFRDKLDDLADDSTEYLYWKFDADYFEDPVIGYKQILNETKTPEQWSSDDDYKTRYLDPQERKRINDDLLIKFTKEFDQFKTDSTRTVNYLVKEFEMKKSAQMQKRAMISKVGSLDMKKVYAHKLKDDLFKRVTSLPQGKNHGMVLLVDWSGSMQNVLQDTLKQVINLAMFCNRVQIPYRVLAFSTDYTPDRDMDELRALQESISKKSDIENLLNTTTGFKLLELFSSKMTTVEFNSMSKRVLDSRFTWNHNYATGGTPLNESLVYIYNTLGRFIKNNSLEKTTFITLTDGEGGSLSNHGRGNLDDTRTEIVNSKYNRIKIKHFIRDNVTQKTYQLTRDGREQTETILRMIKDRHNVSIVGFHICENRKYDLRQALHSNLPAFKGDHYSLIETWRKDFRVNGFTSVKNTGRDELFIIPNSSTKIDEGELQIDNDANARMIAKNFGKFLNVKKTSRVLLNKFVALVA